MNIRKNPLLSIAAGALLFAGAGCHKDNDLNAPSKFTAPARPMELKLKWMPNERVVQDLDMKMNMEMNMPSMPAPVNQEMTVGEKYALKVLAEEPGGGHELEMEFLSVRMKMVTGGRPMLDYDSAKPASADAENPMAKVFGKIVGAKIQYFLNATNGVDRIEGIPALLERISAGADKSAVAPLQSMFNEGYFKQLMSSSQFLPSKAVQPGDTWPVQIEVPAGDFATLVMSYTFTFKSWETHGLRTCARLEFQGDVKSKPGENPSGMRMDIQDGTASGASWFDPELGIIIDTTMNQDMKMTMTIPMGDKKQTINTQMSQVLSVKLDSVQ